MNSGGWLRTKRSQRRQLCGTGFLFLARAILELSLFKYREIIHKEQQTQLDPKHACQAETPRDIKTTIPNRQQDYVIVHTGKCSPSLAEAKSAHGEQWILVSPLREQKVVESVQAGRREQIPALFSYYCPLILQMRRLGA